MKKTIFLLLAIISIQSFAQQSPEKIYDLASQSQDSLLSLIINGADTIPYDSTTNTWQVKVFFKLSQPAQIDSVTIKLGTAQYLDDITTGNYPVTSLGNTFYLGTNQVWGNSCMVPFSLNYTNYKSLKWIEVQATDTSGLSTQAAYYEIK